MAASLTPMERLKRSGVKPDRSLGQNFLIDPNILDVIEQTAQLSSEDVVLEVGPGLGVLTERLLDRCGVVHCVELDADLAAMLDSEFGVRKNFRLHVEDAMKLEFVNMRPAPVKFVANLPYNVAAPLVMKSLAELSSLRLWCLMLQKEIADRLFAPTGAANYGGISVMVRLLARKVSARPISGSVFYPEPRVRSSLLAFKRRESHGEDGAGEYAAAPFSDVRRLVAAAFSHRRKTLVNSVAEAERDTLPPELAVLSPAERKRLMAKMLAAAGIDTGTRAQNLEPGQYEELALILAGYRTGTGT